MLNTQETQVATYLHWVKGIPQKDIAELLSVTLFEVEQGIEKYLEAESLQVTKEADIGDSITFLYKERQASGKVEKRYNNSVLVSMFDIAFSEAEDVAKTIVNHKRYTFIDTKKIPEPTIPQKVQTRLGKTMAS
ncbi:DUF2187 family protein [Bacillus thuringiensis]|uniref:DUF2187 family protein n=1 Tax=Bacillus thuringiensis TaxID=1428 RepID=UPI000BFBFD5D|nr:DUF2187 family protein [Bacillus thuringiensis]PGT89958.1 hypothetical protein COD17_09415 [Bacillus thuringiensis]